MTLKADSWHFSCISNQFTRQEKKDGHMRDHSGLTINLKLFYERHKLPAGYWIWPRSGITVLESIFSALDFRGLVGPFENNKQLCRFRS
jgi:hypothetical protein